MTKSTVNIKLTGGKDYWHTNETADGKSIMVSDGPHGLRVQPEAGDHVGMGRSLPATCFPPAVGLASTWNPQLAGKVGEAIAHEAKAQGAGVVLGPGMNIKRDPRCGRNFEYFSEDPFLTGSMACGFVDGVQSQGVGTSVKHFAANSQETDRMRRDSQIDERTLREIYLSAFERVVKQSSPWTVMCSYNSLNGTLVSQNHWLLTEVLRDEWGYDGVVVSDWGAVRDRAEALKAGLDLEMPRHKFHEKDTLAAVENGTLDEKVVRKAASRVAELIEKASKAERTESFDKERHHELAREVAEQSIVLLKNDGLLPLQPETSVAVVGEFAVKPRYQGAGSSLVNPTKLENALDSIKGFTKKVVHATEEHEAIEAAKRAEVVLYFMGLDASRESEGFDRTTIDLPDEQLQLLDKLLEVNSNVVVILSNGAVVTIPFADKAPAILESWLLGQAGGSAIANIIFGKANPSGRLAETIPLRLEDCPSYPYFPGDDSGVRYGEGLFVGYRGYDARDMQVSYPFGFGLSYTTFEFQEPKVSVTQDGVKIEQPLVNTGDVAGREVVQAYVSVEGSSVVRVPKELKGFANVYLEPGESKTAVIEIPFSDLAYWSTREHRLVVEGGDYKILLGSSSRDINHSRTVKIDGDEKIQPLTLLSTVAEVLAYPGGKEEFEDIVRGSFDGNDLGIDIVDIMGSAPMSAIAGFTETDPKIIEAKLTKLMEANN